MKKCTQCKNELPLEMFHTNYNKRRGKYYPRSECKECAKKRRNKYAKDNPEKQREWSRGNYQRHREERLLKAKEYYKNNKSKVKEYFLSYYKKNKATIIQRARARELKFNSARGSFTQSDVIDKLELQGGLCYYCKKELEDCYEIDHKIPISRNGTNWPSNLAICCMKCNRAKRDKPFFEFIAP